MRHLHSLPQGLDCSSRTKRLVICFRRRVRLQLLLPVSARDALSEAKGLPPAGFDQRAATKQCYTHACFRIRETCSAFLGRSPFRVHRATHAYIALMLTLFAHVVPCCSAALQFVVANSDSIDAFAEFKDRSKPLFILYKKGAKLTVCTRRGKSWA